MSAIRAATAGSRTLRSDVKDPRVFARDLFDAAARHRTELVHTPFYGVRCVTVQTPAPTGSIHAKGGRATLRGEAHTGKRQFPVDSRAGAMRPSRCSGRESSYRFRGHWAATRWPLAFQV